MVFYRKYRPQTISELDNEQVRNTLLSVLSAKTTSHAFLFTGPKGLGKTSAARIVAKVVNCVGRGKKARDIEPCNECDQCVSITKGISLDVIEIDAASNRGIDEIRDLKEKIRLSPVSAKKKIYIIDEVHMLTTEAFNALLKTLEEPPAHGMFILCTTEPHKVPSTIISRCFHIMFRSATYEELVRSLRRIATGEDLTIDDEALHTVATLSEGGFRDGAKILEELSLLAKDQEITKSFILGTYKITNILDQVQSFMKFLLSKDLKQALLTISELQKEGADMKFFLLQVIESFHQLLLASAGVAEVKDKKIPLSTTELITLLTLLSRAATEMKTAALVQLPLEIAAVEWTLQESSARSHDGTSETPPRQMQDNKMTLSSARKQVGNIAKNAILQSTTPTAGAVTSSAVVASYELLHYSANGEATPEWVTSFWQGMIAKMKNHNHTIAGVLRGCQIANFEKDVLTIQTAYQFHKDKLEQTKVKDLIETICKELTGNSMKVSIKLKSKASK